MNKFAQALVLSLVVVAPLAISTSAVKAATNPVDQPIANTSATQPINNDKAMVQNSSTSRHHSHRHHHHHHHHQS